MARRMPISRMRSRTATSITLATPMPPTIRLMAAMAVISRVKLVEDAWRASIRLVGSRVMKSLSSSGPSSWLVRRVAVTSPW